MKKLFYVNYNRLKEIDNKNTPIGVVLDTREIGTTDYENFLQDIIAESSFLSLNVQSIIIKLEFTEQVVELMKNHLDTDVYYVFYNEDIVRSEIQKLPTELVDRVIGNKICKTAVDVILYRMSGINKIQIASPLINTMDTLKVLKSMGWTLLTAPNINDSWGDMIDPNWIRPEGLKLYEEVIDSYILSASNTVKINTVLNAYTKGAHIGDLKDFIVNFNHDLNPYRNQKNFLSETFDIVRANSGDNMYHFERIKREFETANLITGVKKESC